MEKSFKQKLFEIILHTKNYERKISFFQTVFPENRINRQMFGFLSFNNEYIQNGAFFRRMFQIKVVGNHVS